MNDRVKATIALTKIGGSRSMGNGVSDERNVKDAGLHDMNEFWKIHISEPMPRLSFINTLATFFSGPTLEGGGQIYKLSLSSAINFLNDIDEVTLIKLSGKEPLVQSRQVVERLLAMPKRAHLIPESLKAFIEGTKATTETRATRANGRPIGTGYRNRTALWSMKRSPCLKKAVLNPRRKLPAKS